MKKYYGMTDKEKAYKELASDYDADVMGVIGCLGVFIGGVLSVLAIAIYPDISFSTLAVIFLAGTIGTPWLLYKKRNKNYEEAAKESKMRRQKIENEVRLSLRARQNFANAPTTLIANAIIYNPDFRKDAVKSNSYSEFVQCQENNGGGWIVWNKENVKLSLRDPRLNFIELDSVIKKITVLKPTEKKIAQNSNTKNNNSSDISTQLRELKKLLDDGIITQEDFDAKKKKLLNI